MIINKLHLKMPLFQLKTTHLIKIASNKILAINTDNCFKKHLFLFVFGQNAKKRGQKVPPTKLKNNRPFSERFACIFTKD